MVSGVSVQPSRRPKKTTGQIEKETKKKRISNIEQGIMNFEVRYSIDFNRKDRAKRYHKSSIFPPQADQYSIPACPGWG
jgi:hypothetical protein